MPLQYEDFDLLIAPSPPDYSARVLRSPAGEASHTFALPFSRAEIGAAFPYLPDAPRHFQVGPPPSAAASAPVLDPRVFGTRLYDSVFGGEIGSLFQRSLDHVRAAGTGLRVRLRLTTVPELAALPWEYLFVPQLDRFLALSAQTPLIRYLELAQPVSRLAVNPPLHILAVAPDPPDVEKLALAHEWSLLEQSMAPLTAQGLCTLEKLEPPTISALQARLRGPGIHILHFMGHGYFDSHAQQGGLIFEEPQGFSRRLDAPDLALLCHDHPALRLLVLNACQGATAGHTAPFAGVAQRLVQQGIPAVMAMQFPISDEAALALTREFYAALAGVSATDPAHTRSPLPIDAALAEARKTVYLMPAADNRRRPEWGTPVLYSRAPDGILLSPASQPAEIGLNPETPPMSQSDTRPWWEQLAAANTQTDAIETGTTQGDIIIATVGAGARNIAVGKHIAQQIYEAIGAPTPDDRAIIRAQLAQVQTGLATLGGDPQRSIAEFQLELLAGELTKTEEDETPSASTIMAVGDWLLTNLPDLAESLAALFVTPAVGRVVGKAGDALVGWVKARFGGRK